MPETKAVAWKTLEREPRMTKIPTSELEIKRKTGMRRRGSKQPQKLLNNETPLHEIMSVLEHGTYAWQIEAARACEGHSQIDSAKIHEMQRNPNWMMRYAALYACRGRLRRGQDLPVEYLLSGITDADSDVRMLAIRVAADYEDAPESWFVEHLKNDASWVRREARKACEKRGIPY